ncbi:MAG TPA: ATP-binding cassette domain-containing protein [Kofleriaceae bacterium]|jgi:cell division transport system ATP-binding protein|nr:ATP-binding cassette domain-containing protein [Kofleriaceae bacterium]
MIELAGVRLERPRAAAPLFAGVDLTVNRGDVVLITGCAGAGTTTLISALIGDVAPAEGTVSLFGRNLARLRRSSLLALRRRLGVIPQDLQLLPECTALANVELPLEIDHVPRRDANARAAAALGRLGLADHAHAHVHELSGAERQRVAIARALVRAPSLLLADQPTAMQDGEGADLIAGALQEAASLGAAVLVAGRDPHLIAAADRLGWRQLMVHRGRLVDVTDLVTIDEDVPEEIVIEAMPAEPELAPIIEFPAVARSRGAR